LRLNLTVSGNLRGILAAKGLVIQDASNAAVVRQTDETKGEMRVQIAQRLSPRAANALRSRRFVNPTPGGGEGEVVGFINSAWFRKPKAGGDDIDIFKSFETGAVIRPVRAQNLAIPLEDAYTVTGLGGRGPRPTPRQVETRLGVKLFVIKSKRGNRFLAITPESGPVALGRGRKRTIKPARFVKTTGGRSFPTTRRAAPVRVPIRMFLLLKNSRLPKRLDFAQTRAAGEKGLADKFVVELARREPR
jgi:hypothetical protein